MSLVSGLPDIRRPGEVDAAWLTSVLQASGVDAVVKSFTAKAIGTGQIGDSLRFKLDYERAPPTAPNAIVGKFPSADPQSFGTGVMLGNYLREVMFYRNLAAGALIRTPHCLFTDVAADTGEFVLMMEDLAPAEQGDQLKGLSLDQAQLVIDEAAKLHASHWNDDGLDELPWVSGSKAAPPSSASPDLVQALWSGFKDRYGPRLSPESVEIGARLATSFGVMSTHFEGPRCLTHNDFRPDNMMFGTPAGGHPITTLDWQSFAYGVGATDVAYFMAGALPPEVRRAAEPQLLDRYLAGLIAHGVSGYDRSDLMRDYRRGAYLLFTTAFFAAMIVKQTDRGDDMFMQMLSSATAHMIDHDALSSIPTA